MLLVLYDSAVSLGIRPLCRPRKLFDNVLVSSPDSQAFNVGSLVNQTCNIPGVL